VHIGARIVSEAVPGQVLVSRTVKDLVAGSLVFVDTGDHRLKGIPVDVQLFSVS
jgi:class 3 adenylate cyclase